MPEIPVTPEVVQLLAHILLATRQGVIDWRAKAPDTLSARLEGEYCVTLNEVADFDGAPDTDYVLSVSIRDQEIFHLDRTMIGAAALSAALPVGEAIQHSSQFFSELWRRAFLQAHKISEHVDFLNKALEKKIVPF